MADFFSQFQVHPPGPNMGNEGQYAGVPTGAQPTAANGYQSPFQDFNLGGLQQDPAYTGPTGAASAGMGVDTAPPMQLPDWAKFGNYAPNDPYPTPDPRVTTQPQPWLQGPDMRPAMQGLPDSRPVMQGGPDTRPIMQQNGFYSPPAVNMGANGPQQVPMNPSQPSGALGNPMVQMTGPDGSQQFVDPQHVPHYQGLGAQVTGQQLAGMGGSSYGGGNG